MLRPRQQIASVADAEMQRLLLARKAGIRAESEALL